MPCFVVESRWKKEGMGAEGPLYIISQIKVGVS